MMSIAALICAVIGYLLFFATDWIGLPLLLMLGSFVIAVIDLVTLYHKEKLLPADFVQEAFRERIGSTLSVIAGLVFIVLLILV